MNAREQAEYEEKRERVKPAFRFYLDQKHMRFVKVTKEEYAFCTEQKKGRFQPNNNAVFANRPLIPVTQGLATIYICSGK